MFQGSSDCYGIISGGCLSVLWLFLVGLGIALGERGTAIFLVGCKYYPHSCGIFAYRYACLMQTGLVRAGNAGWSSAGLTGSTILWVFFEWVSFCGEY